MSLIGEIILLYCVYDIAVQLTQIKDKINRNQQCQ